ncbi:GNAT family N-acetyltransferase [Coccidioides immitis RS]|uniref:GNAT family N-acetyltransferase n=6 Tax=Coccidioides TaxID=5500 RepID=A0A0D8JTS5_COCIM|nr:hypothetical protein CPC735_060290 [Coccidioides posadasii C735 delta SOWgp]XP_012214218.1 GNAT family N-acetyltransferase [Coccidioides immitis RS]EFW18140.1 conserved hypothetical protein [Coccidioides posadasii str. Silveira]KMM66468.1 hypothetical protein CPAG_02807 [Coccidioides posadasii RMSCC 3488]KMO99926.1 hypothetical protein CIRG_00069 [Coccidioides immitis RMSCC 2394]KMU88331.1 hypothetical protein CIHG_06129 [Coccidioides immitis H538.4]TPX26906.1 hypothetical protein DIZ76_01|eukprot:XP_003066804.1 hypothetical protein CPC735_060290 [Coccidioides posadasii C735 delta SOWgp]
MHHLQEQPKEWSRSITDDKGEETQFVISTDRSLLSIPSIIAAFNEDYVYWARSVPESAMKQMLDNSVCFGIYKSTPAPNSDSGEPRNLEQIGLTRLITDCVTFIYLCDVYIHPEYQSCGLGTWLMGVIQEEMDKMQYLRRLMLMTRGDRTRTYYERLFGVEVMGKAGEAYVMGRLGAGNCV